MNFGLFLSLSPTFELLLNKIPKKAALAVQKTSLKVLMVMMKAAVKSRAG